MSTSGSSRAEPDDDWERVQQAAADAANQGSPSPREHRPSASGSSKGSFFSFQNTPSFSSIMGGKSPATSPRQQGPPPVSLSNGMSFDDPKVQDLLYLKKEETDKLRQSLEKCKREVESLKNTKELLEANLRIHDDRATLAEAELKEANRKNQALLKLLPSDAELSDKGEDLPVSEATVRKLLGERDAAVEDKKETHQLYLACRKEVKELKEQKERVGLELRQAEDDVRDVREQRDLVQKELQELTRQSEEREALLRALEEEKEGLCQDLRTAEQEKALMEQEADAAKRDLNRHIREEKTKRINLENQMAERLREKAAAEEELAEERRRNFANSARVVTNNAVRLRTAQSNAQLTQRVAELQAELAHAQQLLQQPEEDIGTDLENLHQQESGSEGFVPRGQEQAEDAGLSAAEEELKALKVRVVELEAHLEEAQRTCAALEEEGRQQKEHGEVQLEEAKRAAASLEEEGRQQMEESEKLVEQLRLELQMMRREKEALQADLAANSEKALSLEKEEGAKGAAAELEEVVEKQKQEIEQLVRETEQWNESYTERDRRVTTLESKIGQMLAQEEAATANAVAQVKEQLLNAEQEVQGLRKRQEKLQNELETVTSARDSLQMQLQEAESALDTAAQDKQALQTRLDEVASLETMAGLLQKKIQEKEEENEKLRKDKALLEIDFKTNELALETSRQQMESIQSASQDEPIVRVELMESQIKIRHLQEDNERQKVQHAQQVEALTLKMKELEEVKERQQALLGGGAEAEERMREAESAAARYRAEVEQLQQQALHLMANAEDGKGKVLQLEAALQEKGRRLSDMEEEREHYGRGAVHGRITELEMAVAAERQRAFQMEAVADNRVRAVQAEVQHQIDSLRLAATTSMQEVQTYEELLQRIEAFDIRMQPPHRLRLFPDIPQSACSICRRGVVGWGWRCVVPHCGDTMHLGCLTGR